MNGDQPNAGDEPSPAVKKAMDRFHRARRFYAILGRFTKDAREFPLERVPQFARVVDEELTEQGDFAAFGPWFGMRTTIEVYAAFVSASRVYMEDRFRREVRRVELQVSPLEHRRDIQRRAQHLPPFGVPDSWSDRRDSSGMGDRPAEPGTDKENHDDPSEGI